MRDYTYKKDKYFMKGKSVISQRKYSYIVSVVWWDEQ